MPPVKEELELIEPILKKGGGFVKTPNMVVTMYKGRASKYPKGIKIWQYIDFGTMRTEDLFATDQYYEPITVEKTYVRIEDDENQEEQAKNTNIQF